MNVVRRSLAALAAIGASGTLATLEVSNHGNGVLALPIVMLAAAGVAVFVERLGPQLLARGILWSNLLLGVFLSLVGRGQELSVGSALAISMGGALLVLGRNGLDEKAPSAFRGTLLVAMIMAIADTETLLLWTVWAVVKRDLSLPIGTLSAALALSLAVFGLYRGQVWGLFLSVLANVAIGGLAAAGLIGITQPEIVTLLVASAIAQLVVPLPLFVALVRGRAPKAKPWTAALAPIGLVLLMALSAASAYVQMR